MAATDHSILMHDDGDGPRVKLGIVVVHIAIIIATWGITVAVDWGYMNAKLNSLDQRLSVLEAQHNTPEGTTVTKDQFQEFREDMITRLARIEQKQDLLETKSR